MIYIKYSKDVSSFLRVSLEKSVLIFEISLIAEESSVFEILPSNNTQVCATKVAIIIKERPTMCFKDKNIKPKDTIPLNEGKTGFLFSSVC